MSWKDISPSSLNSPTRVRGRTIKQSTTTPGEVYLAEQGPAGTGGLNFAFAGGGDVFLLRLSRIFYHLGRRQESTHGCAGGLASLLPLPFLFSFLLVRPPRRSAVGAVPDCQKRRCCYFVDAGTELERHPPRIDAAQRSICHGGPVGVQRGGGGGGGGRNSGDDQGGEKRRG